MTSAVYIGINDIPAALRLLDRFNPEVMEHNGRVLRQINAVTNRRDYEQLYEMYVQAVRDHGKSPSFETLWGKLYQTFPARYLPVQEPNRPPPGKPAHGPRWATSITAYPFLKRLGMRSTQREFSSWSSPATRPGTGRSRRYSPYSRRHLASNTSYARRRGASRRRTRRRRR